MIHYICDRCKRQIDIAEQTRYIVHIEIQSATDEPIGELTSSDMDDDLDQLTELHEFLESLHDESLDEESQLSHRGRYDLCPDCHHQFLKNPLGRDSLLAFGFSNN